MSASRGHLPPTRGGSSKPFWACFPPLRAGQDCHVTYELASTALPAVLSIGRWRRVRKLVLVCDEEQSGFSPLTLGQSINQSAAATQAACAARQMLRSGEAFKLGWTDEECHECVCVCVRVRPARFPGLGALGWGAPRPMQDYPT